MIKTILSVLSLLVMLSCSMTGKKDMKQPSGMCAKLPMAADGIVRLSKLHMVKTLVLSDQMPLNLATALITSFKKRNDYE